MKKSCLYFNTCIVTTFVVTMLFSCKNNFKEVQQIGVLQNQPIGVAKNINLKYTEAEDSIGRLIANLKSPKMLDYSNREFAFQEFPEGVVLSLFDEKGQKNVVLADYAIVYGETDLIDMQGNVILITPQKDSLFAEQMYYDQKQEWLFSNLPVSLKSATSNSGHGDIFDSDTKFKNYTILEGRGDMIVKD
ncbi:LPS export ABC transporter periplasmic protein LptC [Subsaximicrobium wynnwilliamsii]|uniref:LPS export ABC transporter periplasmic protein LptC n=1 Tax=Subsaximicrobium wynnwilliamsii TaxID=291179 RepID=A0A5C6ZIB2_9FLAO|nr:LPS export ABC transporter periplasmic protein LptC [Subsaximicrobium wynnwilliamsii]TXD83501.1 LPS export ABC transporter periplasmic protein LptC [Subsaximicrobium wynnwilliamsii]TXD89224.1 LPS export ABC transporter periplasmic protein LptC [Subsaximicrobium wynnwilliamsii]TXE03181.1 LPS export ABC transporter periplasmic protein LptC [Subsaximicrobium wynnwilliamsii]